MLGISSPRSLAAGGLLLVFGFSSQCLAQTAAPAPQRSRVIVTQVKPDMLNEWMDIQKNEVNPAMKKAGVTRRTVSRSVFGNLYEFTSITPLDSYASMDGPNPFARILGPEAAARLSEKSRKCVTSSRSYVITAVSDLSILPDPQQPPPISSSTRLRVAPGKRQEYTNFVKNELLPLYKKAKAEGKIAGYRTSARGFGANTNEITVTTYYNKFADLDGGPLLTRMLGQEGVAKLFSKTTGLTTNIETVLRRRVPDLSF